MELPLTAGIGPTQRHDHHGGRSRYRGAPRRRHVHMPPQRFNYQQRVGRAGRRREPFSFALTVCRDRTHDEYYFSHPSALPMRRPPSPYLDLGRIEVLRRTVAAEGLRMAFRLMADADSSLDLGDNVHGEFGLVDHWSVQSSTCREGS